VRRAFTIIELMIVIAIIAIIAAIAVPQIAENRAATKPLTAAEAQALSPGDAVMVGHDHGTVMSVRPGATDGSVLVRIRIRVAGGGGLYSEADFHPHEIKRKNP
jgi:prepilin-type N-terminal cleavage/methylation domain-containing protein